MAARVTMVHEKLNTAATAIPEYGSTTQSSETADRVGIEDMDSVLIREGQISLTIENKGSGTTWDSISMTDDNVVMNTMNSDGNHIVQLTQVLDNGGIVYLDTVIDIDNPSISFEDVDTTPERLMVGDVYTPIGVFVTLNGVLGELVCLNPRACNLQQEDASFEFRRTFGYAFVPEGTTTQIAIRNGDVADSRFYQEVRFDEALGTLHTATRTSNCVLVGCAVESDLVEGSSDSIITRFRGIWDFIPHGGQTLVIVEDDTDYLIGGTWLYIPADREALEVGAFADGSAELTNLHLSGTASYSGNANGIRVTANTSSKFSADVLLNADFDTSTIDGMIAGSELPSDLILGGEDGNIISDTSAPNFGSFAGDTNMDDGYTGKWGGNFYGDGATSAAGTFGVSKGTAGEEDFDSLIGYFGAH